MNISITKGLIVASVFVVGAVVVIAIRPSSDLAPEQVAVPSANQNQGATSLDSVVDSVPEVDPPESFWTLFESSDGWTMGLPNGWSVVATPEEGAGFWSTALMEDRATPAQITRAYGGRGGPFLFNVWFDSPEQRPDSLEQYNLSSINQISISPNTFGGNTAVFSTVIESSGPDGEPGDIQHRYVVESGDGSVLVFDYLQVKGAEDISGEVEQAIKTIKF